MGDSLTVEAGGLLDVLGGTWLLIHGHLSGVPLPENAFDELTITLHNGSFAIGGDRGRMSIDGCVSPLPLDMLIVAGPDRGRYLPAIVELAGPLLRICLDLSGTSRPAAFAAPAGTRYFLATYRREDVRHASHPHPSGLRAWSA